MHLYNAFKSAGCGSIANIFLFYYLIINGLKCFVLIQLRPLSHKIWPLMAM